MKPLLKHNLFTILTVFLITTLPFYVLLKVFFEIKLGIPKFGLIIKECVIVLTFGSLLFEFIKAKKLPKFDLTDYLIFGYFLYGIIITIGNGLGFSHIFYGGRYDFMFFVVFMIYKHGKVFLQISTKNLIKLFLFSAGTSLFLGVIVKFLIGEETLILFGFSDYISNWTFNGSIPTHHGLENSGIKRFQGILDGPNTMAYFLIVYSSIFLHAQKNKSEFYIFLILGFIFSLVIFTYSRSALLGIGASMGLMFILNIKYIYKRYKKTLLIASVALIIIVSLLGYVFNEKIYNIVVRPSSTEGHFARMAIGIDRFIEKPLGSGLATSGPAFRSVFEGEISKNDEAYYIPESWFIQQLTEGGFVYFSLFLLIFLLILIRLYKNSKSLFAGLIAILVMNVFLHIFEATYLSYIFFIFIGLMINKK